MFPITPLSAPMPNDWGYKGPGAYNPFFHSTGTAPNYGFVPNYFLWFDAIAVYYIITGALDHIVNPKQSASPAGAEEALRLVQMFIPDAKLEAVRMGAEAGPYVADKPTYSVILPDGSRHNAAVIVDSYYHGGAGVSADSDISLMASLGVTSLIETPGPVDPPAVIPGNNDPAMPDKEGPMGAKTFFPGVFELEPGDTNPVGFIYVAPDGKKYERLATTWREVR